MAHAILGSSCAALIAAFALAMPVPTLAQGIDKYQDVPKPRVAPAPAPPKARAAPVFIEQQPLVVEVMRKAQAKEAENGFCARTNWRTLTPQETDAAFDRDVTGSRRVHNNVARPPTGCGFMRTLEVFEEAGRRCLRNASWQCPVAGRCNYSLHKFCKNSDGIYKWSPG